MILNISTQLVPVSRDSEIAEVAKVLQLQNRIKECGRMQMFDRNYCVRREAVIASSLDIHYGQVQRYVVC